MTDSVYLLLRAPGRSFMGRVYGLEVSEFFSLGMIETNILNSAGLKSTLEANCNFLEATERQD